METPVSVRPEITGAKITATRGRLFLIRVGTKDQVVKFHFLESESSSVHSASQVHRKS